MTSMTVEKRVNKYSLHDDLFKSWIHHDPHNIATAMQLLNSTPITSFEPATTRSAAPFAGLLWLLLGAPLLFAAAGKDSDVVGTPEVPVAA